MEIYSLTDSVPLSYSRVRAGQLVTGLNVSVSVVNGKTNATLLNSVACPETETDSGVYTYFWTHGLTQDTECMVTYTISGAKFIEYIFITNDAVGGRSY